MSEYTFDLHLTPWAIDFLRWVNGGCKIDDEGKKLIEARQFCRTSRSLLRNYYVSFNNMEEPHWKLTRAGELALELVENLININLPSNLQ